MYTPFQMLTIDGEILAEIICSRTNVQLMAIQEKYAEGTDRFLNLINKL